MASLLKKIKTLDRVLTGPPLDEPTTRDVPSPSSSLIFPKFQPGWRFYLAFTTLCTITLAAALDATTISVALPIIAQAINGTAIEAFWSGTSFLLTSTVFQPVFASFSHIFGRKPLLITALAFFTAGAIICAVCTNFTVLLAGRSLQGIGGGGIIALTEIVVTDLVPLRKRGKWFGFLGAMWAVGSTAGPIVGGAFAETISWRWIFWLNLPFCGVGFVLIALFLNLGFKGSKFTQQFARVDWFGMLLFLAATTATIIPITWGGVMYPWSSWQTLVPLILGLAGIIAFGFYEVFVAAEPLMPISIFANWTARITYFHTIVHGMVLWSIIYYIPLYYEAVQGYSPIITGVAAFPESFTVAPASVITGIIIAKTGRYRWAVWSGWVITTFGCGLMILLDKDTSIPAWVFLNLVPGLGTGILFSAMQLSLQASSTNANIAFAVAFFTFFRTFGQAVGVAVGGVIFQNQMKRNLLTYPLLAAQADAYSKDASSLVQVIKMMGEGVQKAQLVQAYADSLKTVWLVMCVLSAAALVSSVFVRGYTLDVEHVTAQRLDEGRKVDTVEEVAVEKSGE
ncbi:hypothetical protein MMC30_003552 [Trapelia coarctata]|nr:hypothetical protein [Trapelia coarctata]